MHRRLLQLLHWFGMDSIALGIVFGISLLFLPLGLWKPGCLLAFTHLQWALILCVVARHGWLRAYRCGNALQAGYLTWLQVTGYNGRRPPPFHSPLRTPWDLLALGLLLGYAHLLTHVSPFYFWVGGTPAPFIFGVLPLAWFLADLFGILGLCQLLRQRTAWLTAGWCLPALLVFIHYPYALLAIGVSQFAINQWSLRRGLRALPHLPPAKATTIDPEAELGGHWMELGPKEPIVRSAAWCWRASLMAAWWTLALTPNGSLGVWKQHVLIWSCLILIGWTVVLICQHRPTGGLWLAPCFGSRYAWWAWRFLLGPLLAFALLGLLCNLNPLFLLTPWPASFLTATVALLLLSLIFQWSACLTQWSFTGVQSIETQDRLSVSMINLVDLKKLKQGEAFRIDFKTKQTSGNKRNRPLALLALLQFRLSPWRGSYLIRSWQDAMLKAGLLALFFIIVHTCFFIASDFLLHCLMILILLAIGAYSIQRLRLFYPPVNKGYREFLRASAWQPGMPLPMGTPELKLFDLLFILWTCLLIWLYIVLGPVLYPFEITWFGIVDPRQLFLLFTAAFLIPRLGCGLWCTLKFSQFCYPLGIALLVPLIVPFWHHPAICYTIAVSITVINEFGLRATLRQFPWPEKQAPNWSRCYQAGQSPGLPLALLDYPPMAPNWGWLLYIGPFMPRRRFARPFGIALLLLSAWWSAILIYALKDDARENTMVGSLVGLFLIAIVSLLLRLLHAEAAMNPLGLLGRLKFGHLLILWKYDRLTLQALGIIGLEVALVFFGFNQHWPAPYAIPAAIILFPLALYYGVPNAERYCLTGIHRIRLMPRNRR